jgi:hypothetical protein
MKKLTNWIAAPVAMLLGSVSITASPQYVCGLTECCCVQKAGKLLCKYGWQNAGHVLLHNQVKSER